MVHVRKDTEGIADTNERIALRDNLRLIGTNDAADNHRKIEHVMEVLDGHAHNLRVVDKHIAEHGLFVVLGVAFPYFGRLFFGLDTEDIGADVGVGDASIRDLPRRETPPKEPEQKFETPQEQIAPAARVFVRRHGLPTRRAFPSRRKVRASQSVKVSARAKSSTKARSSKFSSLRKSN